MSAILDESSVERIFMIIQLTDGDLNHMPVSLCSDLLQWLQSKQSNAVQQAGSASETKSQQLNFQVTLPGAELKLPPSMTQPHRSQSTKGGKISDLCAHSHVRISQLFDIGLLVEKTSIRIRLKQDNASYLGYRYVMSGIYVSPKGKLVYDGKEFDKPSPLATKVNGSTVNGWEYVEIMRNGKWVCLNELRKVWRSVS